MGNYPQPKDVRSYPEDILSNLGPLYSHVLYVQLTHDIGGVVRSDKCSQIVLVVANLLHARAYKFMARYPGSKTAKSALHRIYFFLDLLAEPRDLTPPEFTKTMSNNPPLARFLSLSMVELLTLRADCSLLALKPASSSC